MDAKDIKRMLLVDDNIEKVLEALGCDYIKREQRGDLVSARLPEAFNSDNKRAVQVYASEGLHSEIRNISGFEGDIFSLVSYLEFETDLSKLQSTFRDSLLFITGIFGWSSSGKKRKKTKDYVSGMKALASVSKSYGVRVPNDILDDSILNNFRSVGDYGWYQEGISLATQEKYEIGYDYETTRITIPIRNEDGDLVGVKGRLIENSDVDDYNPKYMYIYNCNISQEWFNMNNARESIIKEKKVYIFESEKSTMLMHTYGMNNALAISSSDISEVQVSMVKNLGLDIDIILAYDKDKSADEVKRQAKRFTNRNVYGIIDVANLLEGKEAPVDKGKDVWNTLKDEHSYAIVKK